MIKQFGKHFYFHIEEELKRLHQALNNDEKEYGQVGYKYEDESSNTSEIKTADDTEYDPELEEAFIPPRELEIPSNMHVVRKKNLKKGTIIFTFNFNFSLQQKN